MTAIKIILAEDDTHKLSQLTDELKANFPLSEIVCARSYSSTIDLVMEGLSDLLILDMAMPVFDISATESGGRHEPYAGREVLAEMERYDRRIPTVVVTQFDRFGVGKDGLSIQELDEDLRRRFPLVYVGYVFYRSASDNWRQELRLLAQRAIAMEPTKEGD